MLRKALVTLALALAIASANAASLPPYKHAVLTWIPPYAIAPSETQLANPTIAHALTHISLQFWVPDGKGGVELTKDFSAVNDGAVQRLRQWGHANGIRVMLCVFNGAVKWDWPLAKTGFAKNQDKFVSSLAAELRRTGLDGIDVDLEGPDQYEGDQPAYIAFLKKLSVAVHQQGKQLMAASFCAQWNAPNRGWWPEILPLVNGLDCMGYSDTGIHAPSGQSYAEELKSAGKYASRVQFGVFSDKDSWLDEPAARQIAWLQRRGGSGIGIWDAQMRTKLWKSPDLWATIAKIKLGSKQSL